jgi:ribosomal protein S18 acetylase RimI-like enzyme
MSGYTQRALTETDAAAYVELVRAMNEADGDEGRMAEADYLYLLNHPLGVPDLDDFTGFFDGDRLVAGGWVARSTSADPAHWMVSDGGVHPDYRGRGIGTALLRWQEALAPVIHERFHPGTRLELCSSAMDGNTGARALFAHEGYAAERWFFEMRRPEGAPEEEPRIPEGLVLETLGEQMYEPLRLVHNEVFRDHWRGTPEEEQEWGHWIGREKVRPQLSFLLRDGANGAVAGYLVSSFSEAEFAETGVRDIHFNLIGTARPYRKRGVASALIAHAVRESRRQGYQTASLGVDAENPSGALGVYESNGFECVHKFVIYNKVLREAAGGSTQSDGVSIG